MSVTYRTKHGKNSTIHRLILKQKGQRTVEIFLGDYAIDSKLALIAPDAMKIYAQDLRDQGKEIPRALQ